MSDISNNSSPHENLTGLRPDFLMASGVASSDGDDGPYETPGYEIENLIGSGGMGKVYLATQTGLDRKVAIKQTGGDLGRDPAFIERLEREAKTMAKLRHPHVVTVHQFEVLPDGRASIVMEYVEGGSLRDRLETETDGLPISECLRLFREIASALSAAHSAGVVHRDLKPENILLDRDGSALLTDFGLAVPLDAKSPRLTLTGTTVGTMDYMAPERFRSGDPDSRSDIYALGVIFYEMLTGRIPRGSFDPPKQIRAEIPERVSVAVMKSLRPDARERFGDVAGFVAALEKNETKISRRVLLGSALLGVAALGGAWRFFRSDPAREDTGEVPSKEMNDEGWRDLLSGIDPARNTVSGNWSVVDGSVYSNGEICILAVEDSLPDAYDIRVQFARLTGLHSIAVFFAANGAVGSVDIDGWGEGLSGVQSIDGRDLRETGGFVFRIENNRVYDLKIEVRLEHISVWIDGILKRRFDIGSHTLGVVEPWQWTAPPGWTSLAIGSYQSPTRFDLIEWRPAIPPHPPHGK